MFNPIVQVNEGKLRGKICKTEDNIEFFTFKGIPYAKPPVGDLRFAVPKEPVPWEGVRDATNNPNICIQYDHKTQSIVGDEDCLYLNVSTPKLLQTHGSHMPVMVFIHGGGFVYGNGTDDSTRAADYLVEKDVVLVFFNYRVGVLGFLSLDCKEAPGNMGMRDQVQALKWVQKNISQFGGDPNNVTIFGVSAGGSSIEYLLLSPLAKGLFHKGIAQSGSSLLPWANNNRIKDLAYKMPIPIGKRFNTDKELLEYLKNLPIHDLITRSMDVLASTTYRGGIYFGFVPTIEKAGDWEPFLDKKPYDLLSGGEFTKVPFMCGFCSREGLLMIPESPSRLEKLCKEKKFLDFLPFDIEETKKDDMENKLKKVYLEGEKSFDDDDAFAIDFFSDVDFIGGAFTSASLIAINNSPVYFYEFAYDGNLNYFKAKNNVNRKGTCHADDEGYLLKMGILQGIKVSETDKLVRSRLLEMWTNFAKHGDPTPQVNDLLPTKWEPITKKGVACLYIDENLQMKERTYAARLKLFEELYSKYDFSS